MPRDDHDLRPRGVGSASSEAKQPARGGPRGGGVSANGAAPRQRREGVGPARAAGRGVVAAARHRDVLELEAEVLGDVAREARASV